MALIIISVITALVVYIYIKRSGKNIIQTQNEAEKLVLALYQITKFDEDKKFFKTKTGKRIILNKEKNQLINLGILFAFVSIIFASKMPGTNIINIIRWFLEIARRLGYSEEELINIKRFLMHPRASETSSIYADYQKETRVITELLIGNLNEIDSAPGNDNSRQSLKELAIATFISDMNIVLSDFLIKEDFPSKFNEI